MSGATGEAIESNDEDVGISSSRLEPQDILLAHEVLRRLGRPLSWKDLYDEYSKYQQGGDWQTLKDAFCRSKVIGFVVCEDFISLDTVKMIALLKLQLIVVICQKFKSGRLGMISFLVNATVTEEEKNHLGTDPTALSKVIAKYQEIFTLAVCSVIVNCIVGTSDKTLKFLSFFSHEKTSPILSAIHKIKYFLNLCHGKSSISTTFKFVQNCLTPDEKMSLGKTKELCVAQIHKYQDDLKINRETVELLPPHRWHNPPKIAETVKTAPKMDGSASTSSKTNNPVLPQDDLLLLHKILQDGPLSWSEFADAYGKHKPGNNFKALQERIYQSSPSGFVYSPDFISLDTAWCVALLKLQLIVVADNKLQNGQLGKISYHFNIAATDEERGPFGKSSNKLAQSLQKYPLLFNLSPAGSARRDVAASSKTIPFHTFFSFQGRDKASLIHKLKYFLNLCGGLSSVFSVYEFARNLTTNSEKRIFRCDEHTLVHIITDLSDQFQVTRDDIKLRESCLWYQELKKSINRSKHQDQKGSVKSLAGGNKSQIRLDSSLPQPGEILTADFVLDVLNNHARYPMDWNEFKNKFLKSKQNADVMIANFVETFSKKALKSLCFSTDFVALNTPFHRNRLKLQLILAIRKRSTNTDAMSLAELHEQLAEIASQQEIEQTELNCDDFRGFLEKFPKVFVIQKDKYVMQGREALQFPSFFQHEKDGPLLSVVHKLNYFVYLCGDYCSISLVCKFLQKHLPLKKELDLVNTDEKVIALIENCESGNLGDEEDKETATEKIESEEERKATALTRAKEMKAVLKKLEYVTTWNHLENHCLANNKSVEWLREFKMKYLPFLDRSEFLFLREFIALNTSFDRAFIKLCLLVSLNVKKKGKCNHWVLFKQFHNIASRVEKENFMTDLSSHLKKYPSVFKLPGRSGSCSVLPGKEMIPFTDFFICEEHRKTDCLRCQFMYFLRLCNGRCNYQKGRNFMQLVMTLNSKAEKKGKTISSEKVDDFIHSCDIAEETGNSEIKLVVKTVASSSSDQVKGSDTGKVSSVPEKEHQPLQHSTEGNSQSPPITQGKTTSSSPTEGNLQSAASSKDPQPSPIPKEAEKTPLKPTEVTHVNSDINSNSGIIRLVKVKIVRNDKILKQVIDRMLNFENERPIISMTYREDALVILNWEGKGFVIPFKKSNLASSVDSAFAEKWSLLGEFFQNPKVTQVTFDCDGIGKFLLENFNLQLNDTVFDVKIGAELLPSEWNPTSVLNVADLCRCLDLPSLDKVDVKIVGDLIPKKGEEVVCLEKSTVIEAVREASALIPGVYGKMFHFLEKMDALKTLHSLTGDKLQSLYNMNMESLLPLDKTYYPSEITDTESMKQSNSPSSISTGSSVPVSSQVSSVDPAAKSLPSGVSEIKGSTEDWFSVDVNDLPTVPSDVEGIFNQNQFSMKPSLPGAPLLSYLQNQLIYSQQSPPVSQSYPQENLLNQLPDFEQSMLEDYHPLTLCKDEAGSIFQVPVEEAGTYDQNLSEVTEELVNLFAAKHKENMLQLLLLLKMDIFETLRDHFKGDFCDSFYQLTDIVLDLGRNAEARFFRHTKEETPETLVASSREVKAEDLAEIEKTDTLTGFGDDNRCGVEGTLHSLRQVRNKKKKMVGLTVRVHKPFLGCADMMYDIALDGKSTLIMGYSGVGKTTLLRELARCLNDNAKKRVIVIDTYNEIAGDYDVPHFSIGGARRLQVDSHENQYQTLLESAKNHSPEVLIVDEIESQNDATAVAKLCQQGIQVIAGVDGDSISNLFNDKNLYQLFQNGGDNRLDDSVSLDSAGALAKSKARPTFEALVEMVGCNRWYVHDLAHTYNCCLSGQPYSVQERTQVGFKPSLVREQQIVLREKLIV